MYKRYLAISDIHGCFNELQKLLEQVKYDPKNDRMIFMGDYVDRGNENLKTLKYIKSLKEQYNSVVVLKGNHELFLESSIKAVIRGKATEFDIFNMQNNKTDVTMEELVELEKEELVDLYHWTKKLPMYYLHDKFIFVHAGVNSTLSFEDNGEDEFLWEREVFIETAAYHNKVVVFGHTPTFRLHKDKTCGIWNDEVYKDKIGIDCGCVYGGNLCCYDVLNKKPYYVSGKPF